MGSTKRSVRPQNRLQQSRLDRLGRRPGGGTKQRRLAGVFGHWPYQVRWWANQS